MADQSFPPCICRDHERATFDRPALFIPVILIMFASVLPVFAFADVHFGVQLASVIPYTAFVFLATFSAQRGQQPYFFECSIVDGLLSRLGRRHIGFLAVVLFLETTGFYLTRFMPLSWLVAKGRNGSPFSITLVILCMSIAFVQVLTNRSILEQAHLQSSCPPDQSVAAK
jgi:hypothetical protein